MKLKMSSAVEIMSYNEFMSMELSFGEWLEDELAQRGGMRQHDLAVAAGIDPSAVSLWISGKTLPSSKNCDAIADVLQLPRNVVRQRAGRPLVRDGDVWRGEHVVATPDTRYRNASHPGALVPILGLVPADSARWTGNAEAVTWMDLMDVAGIQLPAIVIASGDCMAGRGIENGDHVLIDMAAEPIPGDVVVAQLGDDVTLKEWWPDEYGVILRAASPGYRPIRVTPSDDGIRITGVARRVIRTIILSGPPRLPVLPRRRRGGFTLEELRAAFLAPDDPLPVDDLDVE